MSHLPVIVGFGGINAAGRGSFHHAYRRIVQENLPVKARDETLLGLATLMNLASHEDGKFVGEDGTHYTAQELVEEYRERILAGTLIRRIEESCFPVDATSWQKPLKLTPDTQQPLVFITQERQLPEPVPTHWKVTPLGDKQVRVEITHETDILVPSVREFPVKAAGQLPTGFDPGTLYNSRNHPRGLQMTVYAASDAVRSMGIEWNTVLKHVKPDQVAVYAGSAMSQLDYYGSGGMLQARLLGKRVSSKQCALGFSEMPADFVNAYILGSVGSTGTGAGACATFLYNLRMALNDINTGRCKVAVVGTSEAPITPEIADGYDAMGALASDADLMKIDGTATADHRRASRPFGVNCGFTLAESSQFIVLMADDLALELGATIYGAVANVFVNADGHKKSISAPGAGNYITMAKALAASRALLGEQSVAERSFVQAHGSSTPQNRVTESHILNEAAKTFGMQHWPVSAVKAYLGHSIGSAGGDQIGVTLGVWQYGWIPGIKTITQTAPDIYQSNLRIENRDMEVGAENIDLAIINAKGFGGNNATASVLAPHIVQRMLTRKHGTAVMQKWAVANEPVRAKAQAYDTQSICGDTLPIYLFDHEVIQSADVKMSTSSVQLPGFEQCIDLPSVSDYPDMT